LFGPQRIRSLVEAVRANTQFDRGGHYFGRTEMILGLLYKIKKKKALAARHLMEARRIFIAFGPSPTLTRVESALAAAHGLACTFLPSLPAIGYLAVASRSGAGRAGAWRNRRVSADVRNLVQTACP
jgi:hypothetical protein